MGELDMHRHQYDLPTAVTFLIAGLGLGSVLTLLFASRFENVLLTPGAVKHDAVQAAS
jgi:hypothetical protein